MQLKTWMALLGGSLGAAAIVGAYFGVRAADPGLGWVPVVIVAGLGIVLYIVGAISQRSKEAIGTFAEIVRGWLIGMNAAANAVIWFWIFDAAGNLTPGLVLGAIAGGLNFLALLGPLSQSEIFQGFLGWANWIMPMSWLVVALGVGFTLFSVLLAAVTGFQVRYLKVMGCRVDWKTGTIFIKGGLVANLNYLDTAFNMGNFSFVDMESDDWHIDHEAGHSLNLAAFGAIFHLIGALDENLLRRGTSAYSERMADSNDPGTSLSTTNIPIWHH